MKKLERAEIPLGAPLEVPILLVDGTVLFEEGLEVHPDDLRVLREHGVTEVLRPETRSEAIHYIQEQRFFRVRIDDLQPDQRVGVPVHSKDGRLLLPGDATVSPKLKETLKGFGILEVMIRRLRPQHEAERANRILAGLVAVRRQRVGSRENTTSRIRIEDLPLLKDRSLLDAECLDSRIDDAHISNAAPGFGSGRWRSPDTRISRTLRDRRTKSHFVRVREELVAIASQLFEFCRRGVEVPGERIGDLTGRIVSQLTEDRYLGIAAVRLPADCPEHVRHALNVCILSLGISAVMGYTPAQAMELGYGAFLCDIGMMRLPQDLREMRTALSPGQRELVRMHPQYGMEMLKQISDIPESTPFVVYQHHERLDGSGYPKGRSGESIHRFARIVAVADVYHALTSERPHRPALLPYRAMEAILQEVVRGRLDREVVRAFLSLMSVFPVGSWVELSDGSVGRVVGSSGQRHTRPVVSVVIRDGRRLLVPRMTKLADFPGLEIVRAVESPLEPGKEREFFGF